MSWKIGTYFDFPKRLVHDLFMYDLYMHVACTEYTNLMQNQTKMKKLHELVGFYTLSRDRKCSSEWESCVVGTHQLLQTLVAHTFTPISLSLYTS
jgi:hypothetical protein